MIMFGTPRRSKRLSTCLSTEKAMVNTPLYSHRKGRRSLGTLHNGTQYNDIYEASSSTPKASTAEKSPLAAGKENGIDSVKSPSTPQGGNEDSISIYASDVSLLAQGVARVSSPEFLLSASTRKLFDSYDEADDGSIKSDDNHVAAKVKDTAESESAVESAMVDAEKEENSDEYVLIASNKLAVKVKDSEDAEYAAEENNQSSSGDECDDSLLDPTEQSQLMSFSNVDVTDSREDSNIQASPSVLSRFKGGMVAMMAAMEVLEGEFGGDITAMLSKYSKLSDENQDLMASLHCAKADGDKARDEIEAQKKQMLEVMAECNSATVRVGELSSMNEDLEAKLAHLTQPEARVVQEDANHSVVYERDKCKSKLKSMEEELLDRTEEKRLLLKEKEEWIAEKAVFEEQHHAAQDEIRSLEGAKEEANAKSAKLEAALIIEAKVAQKAADSIIVFQNKLTSVAQELDDCKSKLKSMEEEALNRTAEVKEMTEEKRLLLKDIDDFLGLEEQHKTAHTEKEALWSEKEDAIANFAKSEAARVELTCENQALSSENADLKTMVDQSSRATQAEIEALETEKKDANTKSTELQAALEALSSENSHLETQVDEFTGKLGTTVAELEALIKKEKVDASDKLAALSEEKDVVEEDLAEIQAEKSTLDLCLNEHIAQNADLKSQLDITHGKVSTAEAECAVRKTELKELAKEKVDAQGKLAALEQEITIVKAAINEQKKELDDSTIECESHKSSLRMSKQECVHLKEELTLEKSNSASLIDRVEELQIDVVQRTVELDTVREEKRNLEQGREDMRSTITALFERS